MPPRALCRRIAAAGRACRSCGCMLLRGCSRRHPNRCQTMSSGESKVGHPENAFPYSLTQLTPHKNGHRYLYLKQQGRRACCD